MADNSKIQGEGDYISGKRYQKAQHEFDCGRKPAHAHLTSKGGCSPSRQRRPLTRIRRARTGQRSCT